MPVTGIVCPIASWLMNLRLVSWSLPFVMADAPAPRFSVWVGAEFTNNVTVNKKMMTKKLDEEFMLREIYVLKSPSAKCELFLTDCS